MESESPIPPSLQFSVPCLAVDEQQGPPCLMYVFQELPLTRFPYQFPSDSGFFVVNGWCRGRGDFTQRMLIRGPEDQLVADTGDRPLSLASTDASFMAINFVKEVEFPSPGIYTIEVLLDGAVALAYNFRAYVAPSARLRKM